MDKLFLMTILLCSAAIFGMELDEIELKEVADQEISILRFIPNNTTEHKPFYLINNTNKLLLFKCEGLSLDKDFQYVSKNILSILYSKLATDIKTWKNKEDSDKKPGAYGVFEKQNKLFIEPVTAHFTEPKKNQLNSFLSSLTAVFNNMKM